jgi:hypothetical protein
MNCTNCTGTSSGTYVLTFNHSHGTNPEEEFEDGEHGKEEGEVEKVVEEEEAHEEEEEELRGVVDVSEESLHPTITP